MPAMRLNSVPSAHVGSVDGLRHKRGQRYLDFAACDVGRGSPRPGTSIFEIYAILTPKIGCSPFSYR